MFHKHNLTQLIDVRNDEILQDPPPSRPHPIHHTHTHTSLTICHTCKMLSSDTLQMTHGSLGFQVKSEILAVWPPWMNYNIRCVKRKGEWLVIGSCDGHMTY